MRLNLKILLAIISVVCLISSFETQAYHSDSLLQLKLRVNPPPPPPSGPRHHNQHHTSSSDSQSSSSSSEPGKFSDSPTPGIGLEDELTGVQLFSARGRAGTLTPTEPTEKFEYAKSANDPASGRPYLMATIDGAEGTSGITELVLYPAPADEKHTDEVEYALSAFSQAYSSACTTHATEKKQLHSKDVIKFDFIKQEYNKLLQSHKAHMPDITKFEIVHVASGGIKGDIYIECKDSSSGHGVQVNYGQTVTGYGSNEFLASLPDGFARSSLTHAFAVADAMIGHWEITEQDDKHCIRAVLGQFFWVGSVATTKKVANPSGWTQGQLKNQYSSMPKTSVAHLIRTCSESARAALHTHLSGTEESVTTTAVNQMIEAACPSDDCTPGAFRTIASNKKDAYTTALKAWVKANLKAFEPRTNAFHGETQSKYGFGPASGSIACENDGVCPYAAYNTISIAGKPALVVEIRMPDYSPFGKSLVPNGKLPAKQFSQFADSVNSIRKLNGLEAIETQGSGSTTGTQTSGGGPPPPPPGFPGSGPPPPPPPPRRKGQRHSSGGSSTSAVVQHAKNGLKKASHAITHTD
jgi:hypothetical protein